MSSHAFDEGSLAGESQAPQNMACRCCEHASGHQHIRHTVTTNVVFELPVGKDRRYLSDGAAEYVAGDWQLSADPGAHRPSSDDQRHAELERSAGRQQFRTSR